MATLLNTDTFATTYKDDYRDSDNYYRILFNAGRTLQARELTQMQTIIQKEMGRFARNIFNEGAVVNPGGVTINRSIEYIKLDKGSTLPAGVDLLTVSNNWSTADGTISFKILRVEDAVASDDWGATLYIKYTDTSAASAGATTIRVPDGTDISNGTYTFTSYGSASTGQGCLAGVAPGEYFTKDHFVFAEAQTHFVSKYTNNPTADLGFKVVEDVITAIDDDGLYDNQGVVPNTSAPGADRYRIRLILTTRDEVDSADNFVFISRIVNGVQSITAAGFSDYNQINEILALRTKEESGDYIVKNFTAKMESYNDSNLLLNVTPGIAYVDGYRMETPLTRIIVPKADDTTTITGRNVTAQYGNYVLADTSSGIPDINEYELVSLYNAVTAGGTAIGTARVRYGERFAGDIRYYLFDIQMNAGQSFASVKSFGSSGTNYVNVKQTDGIAVLYNTGNNSLLFPLSNTRPTTTGVTVNSLIVQRRYQDTANGSGEITISSVSWGGSSFTFTDPGDWIVAATTGAVVSPTFGAAGGSTMVISGLTAGVSYEIYAKIDISTPTFKAKTITDRTETLNWTPGGGDIESDGSGLWYMHLDRSDVYKVTSIRETDSDGRDLSPLFGIDNGQRDNFYARGRIIRKTGTNVPTGNVFVRYKYFAHGTGHFFSANSYNGVPYSEIPYYRKNDGQNVFLADVLDFRPVQDSNGTYPSHDEDYVVHLPENQTSIDTDVVYYMPRKDRLVLRREEAAIKSNRAEIKYIQGVSSLQPTVPDIPVGSMLIYEFNLNANTLGESDLSFSSIKNLGYTMQDIGRLERRLSKLEELTSLTLLENAAQTELVLDSDGLPRTKSGFLADNFSTSIFADYLPGRYRASIDTDEQQLLPPFVKKNVRLIFDSDASLVGNVRRTGEFATLDYSEVSFAQQLLATETMNVNPFEVITSQGYTILSPATDEWVETRYEPDLFEYVTVSNQSSEILRQALENGWTAGGVGTAYITGDKTTNETIGNKQLRTEIIPWMRSKLVRFKTVSLRPNTRYFAFFNGIDVSDWVRPEGGFQLYATTDSDYGNTYQNATQHPLTPGQLISDADGILTGSFFIPATDNIRFRTGTAEFKLMDVSVYDNEAISTSISSFTSAGTLDIRQKTIRSTRSVTVAIVPPPPPSDPLAQSFYIDRVQYPNGVFITSCDIFIKTKDADVPIQCEIVTMENGTPTQIVVPGAFSIRGGGISGSAVVAIEDIGDVDDIDVVKANPTNFVFDEPVYLSPGREYAIRLKAETAGYNVYVAKTYDFVIGTTSSRVTKQPSLGSLFQSQNSSTWTPDQTRDLMFKLYRAEFDTSGYAILENGVMAAERLPANRIRTVSGDSDVTILFPGHGFIYGDVVTISGLTDSVGGVVPSAINGTHKVYDLDWTGISVGSDSQADFSAIGGGSILVSQQAHFDEIHPLVTIMQPEETTVGAGVKLTAGGSYASTTRNRMTGSGTRSKSSSYTTIQLNEKNYLDEPKVILTPANETLISAKSATMRIDLTTADTKVSPVIDLQRVSMILTENVIDNQDSAATTGFNVPLVWIDEADPTEGSIAAKHLTKKVTLAEPASGIKVFLSANRPAEADIKVYYKSGTSDTVLDDVVWTEIAKEAELPADNDRVTYREYSFLAGGDTGTLAPFSQFQVKVVMTSTNSSRVPRIKDLRIIALAT